MGCFEQKYWETLTTENIKAPISYEIIFGTLKSTIINKIKTIMLALKNSTKGRKQTVNLDVFLDAYFEKLDNGSKIKYIKKHYTISEGSYNRYKKFMIDHNILGDIYGEFVNKLPQNSDEDLMTDTTTVLSLNGKDGVGFSYKEKKQLKLEFLALPKKLFMPITFQLVMRTIEKIF